MSNNDEIFFGSNNGVAKLKRESLNVSKLDDSPRSKFLYIHENQYVYIYKNTIEIKDIYQKTLYKKSFSVDFSEMLFENNIELSTCVSAARLNKACGLYLMKIFKILLLLISKL